MRIIAPIISQPNLVAGQLLSLIMFALLIHGCEVLKPQEKNSLAKAKKVTLKQEGPTEILFWELRETPKLWATDLRETKAIQLYRDSLMLEMGKEKFEAAVQKESTQHLSPSLIESAEDGDRTNALLVHTGSVGSVRKINQLEAQILSYQIGKYPLFGHPTEFHGFIAKHAETGILRIYFAASDTEWPPHPNLILDELDKELKKGWKLIGHLHNHYCKKDKDYIGILAPSLADAQYFKMLKEEFQLERAFITNGFHTVVIESEDFERFESH